MTNSHRTDDRMSLEFPDGCGPERPAVLKRGDAIMGRIVWRSTVAGNGYQYMPFVAGRRPSRVLRPTIYDALIKAGVVRAAKARALIQEAP